MPDSRSSLPSTHRFATTLPQRQLCHILEHRRATVNNLEPKDLFLSFSAKCSPIFALFYLALIGHLRNVCLALEDTFSLTLLRGVFLAGQNFPPRRRTAVTEAMEKEDDTARQTR